MSYQGDEQQETLEIFEYLNDLIRFNHWKINCASAVVKVIISTAFLVIYSPKSYCALHVLLTLHHLIY